MGHYHKIHYDQIVQGLSGVMTITGDQKNNPYRVGYPIADTIGGLTAAMAVSAALNNPKGGNYIDVSMLEATLVTMGWVISNYRSKSSRQRKFYKRSIRCISSKKWLILLQIKMNSGNYWLNI